MGLSINISICEVTVRLIAKKISRKKHKTTIYRKYGSVGLLQIIFFRVMLYVLLFGNTEISIYTFLIMSCYDAHLSVLHTTASCMWLQVLGLETASWVSLCLWGFSLWSPETCTLGLCPRNRNAIFHLFYMSCLFSLEMLDVYVLLWPKKVP